MFEKILLFGIMLEGDIFVEGIGTTVEDEILYKKAMTKWFNVDENTPEETFKILDGKIDEGMKELVKKYRGMLKEYTRE